MRYQAFITEPDHKLNTNLKQYKFVDNPTLNLISRKIIHSDNQFTIEVIWSFIDNENKFIKHQTYTCDLEVGDNKENIIECIFEIIKDSIIKLNKSEKNIDVSMFKEYISAFIESLPIITNQ